MNKFEIVKSGSQKYPYNARILTSVDGGENYYYCGNGRYCKTLEEAIKFIKSKAVEELKEEVEDTVFAGKEFDEDCFKATFKNGTKKLNITDVDGMDIYTISEKDGKKYIRMNGWFYLNDEGTHSTSVTFEEMPVEEFIKHKAINAFGYDKFISDIIDCGKQYIIDYSEEAAQAILDELDPSVLFLADLNEYVPAGVYISPIRSECRVEDETSSEAMEVNVPGGVLRVTKSSDPEYPGIDIEFIATAEDQSCGKFLSRPRVLMEYKIEDNELRAAVWADEKSEDYSDDIEFNKHYYNNASDEKMK